jgi:molecular chaperone HscB
MSSRASEAKVRCWRCSQVHPSAFFCPSCNAVQKLPSDTDYLTVLGLPPRPAVEGSDLQTRYYELSRKLHPDRYQTSSPEERTASVSATAVLNAAFRTLRDLESRGRYWLTREGEALGHDNNRVPPSLAAYVFDVQEQLAEVAHARDGERAGLLSGLRETERDLLARRQKVLRSLDELLHAWPATNAVGNTGSDADDEAVVAARAELKRLLSELSYLGTLVRDVDAALESASDGASPTVRGPRDVAAGKD